jgi:hypothetical protein
MRIETGPRPEEAEPQAEDPPALQRGSHMWRPTSRAVLALLLGGVLPIVMLDPTSASFSPAFFLQYVVVLHSSLGLTYVLTAPTIRVVQFGFWTFSYVWMGLAPLAMLITGTFPWTLVVDPDTAFLASVVVEIGLLAYTAGAVLEHRGRRPSPTDPLPRLLRREFASHRVVLLSVVAVLVSLVLLPRMGGLETAFDTRFGAGDARAQLREGVENSTFQLMRWAVLVSVFWSMVSLLRLRPLRTPPQVGLVLLMLLGSAMAMNVILNNPISMPRYWAGTVWLALLFSLPWFRRVGVFRIASAGVVLAAAVLFPYSDYFRYEEADVRISSVADQFSNNGDYDAYQQLMTGLSMVDEIGFSPQQALLVPLAWVPRSSWESKPEALGQTIAEYAGYDFTNLSAPLWIESYVWGGFPALVLVFVGLGWLSSRLDGINWSARRLDQAIAGCLVPALAIFQIFFLRGSLLPAMAPLMLLTVVPLLISKRPAQAEPSLHDNDRTGRRRS